MSKLLLENIDRIIALILVIGCLVLIATGIDGEVKAILAIAAGWAFGSTFLRRKGGTK